MNRRQLLKFSLALAGGTLIHQFPYAKENIAERLNNASSGDIQSFRINFRKEKIKDRHRRIDNLNWP